MTRAILAVLLTGCSFALGHPGPGLRGAMECSDGSELIAVDVLGALAFSIPTIIGIDLTAQSATCAPNGCRFLIAPEAAPTWGAITAGLLVIDAIYWASAVHGGRMVQECKEAKKKYRSGEAPAPEPVPLVPVVPVTQ
jgi:hypothetical protein